MTGPEYPIALVSPQGGILDLYMPKAEAPQAPSSMDNEQPYTGPSRLLGEDGWSTAKTIVAVGVVGVAGLAIAGNTLASSDSSDETSAEVRKAAEKNCNDSKFEQVASNADKYNPNAFLPHSKEVKGNDDVQGYIDDLFDKDGPLGGKVDKGSLAVIEAIFDEPAHDGAATNAEFNYQGTFNDRVAAYGSEGGLALARSDCTRAYGLLGQTSEYDASWAEAGEVLTKVEAVNKEGKGKVKLALNRHVTTDKLSGIAVELRGTTKGVDGFTPGFIDPSTGEIYLKGFTEGQGGSAAPNEQQGEAPNPDVDNPKGGKSVATGDKKGKEAADVEGGGGKEADKNCAGCGAPAGACGTGCPAQAPAAPAPGPGAPTAPSAPEAPAPAAPAPTPNTTTPPTTSPPTTTPPTTSPPTTSPPTTSPPTTAPKGTVPPCQPTEYNPCT